MSRSPVGSLAIRAVRGALWTIGTSIGARFIGVVGTLVITHHLAPEVIGEVAVASVLVLTASQLSVFGFGQYVIAKPKSGRAAAFHCTFYYLTFGVLALAAVLSAGHLLAPVFSSPNMVEYLPGLVIAGLLGRVAFMPERILARDMRFAIVGVTRTVSELAYTTVAVWLAIAGWGGEAIVIANIVQAALRVAMLVPAVHWREWLEPARITRERTRDIFRFGTPLAVASSANFAARRWDGLLLSSVFGPAQYGMFNLAYNLADVPAAQVGEHIGDVLLPSFAHLDAHRRPAALVRSTAILALLVFPLAVGLGAISHSLVASLFNEQWQGVAPMLLVLSALSVVRPIGWTVASYLQVIDRTRPLMVLEVGKVGLLLASVGALSVLGPVWACGGVGLTYGVHTAASIWVVRRHDPVPLGEMLAGFLGPIAACVPMVGAVLGVRWAFAQLDLGASALMLVAEIGAGALAYVPAALLFAPAASRDCLGLLRRGLAR
jgi:lipopolysaccharide exporter